VDGIWVDDRRAVDDTFDLGGVATAMLVSVLLVLAATRIAHKR